MIWVLSETDADPALLAGLLIVFLGYVASLVVLMDTSRIRENYVAAWQRVRDDPPIANDNTGA